MRTIACMECGHEIAEDDFILQHCPLCEGYMQPSRLDRKADPGLGDFVRINPVQTSALVEREIRADNNVKD